jgi:glycosyltransferase involved in cell wall biosynthesis
MGAAERARVLHVITGLDVGGAEAMLASLAESQTPELEQAIVTLAGSGYHGPRLRERGIPVHELHLNGGALAPAGLLRVVRLIRRMRPQVVQGWMYHGNVAALLGVVFSGQRHATRVAWGIRCTDWGKATASMQLKATVRANASLSRWADVLVANSQAGLDFHLQDGFRPRRSLVIHNGIDTVRFQPNPTTRRELREALCLGSSEFVAAHVGRVHPLKDHATFVEALRRCSGVRALAIGAGTESLPDVPGLLRLGQRADVAALLTAADVIVLSSESEGFPNVVAEGMAAGLVPIATDVGDVRAIVGDTGFVVPPHSPESMARAIESVAALPPEELARRSRAARDRIAQSFGLEAAIRRFSQLYRELANPEAPRCAASS